MLSLLPGRFPAVLAKLTELGGSLETPIEVEITPEMEAAAKAADADA